MLARLLAVAPPDIDDPSRGDMWDMLKTGKAVRNLGKQDMYRLIRWGPMAVADLVAEFFETELLRAAMAARGIFGAFLGPWSAGSSTVLLMRAASDPLRRVHPFRDRWHGSAHRCHGIGRQGSRRRDPHGRRSGEIRVKDGAAIGVVLGSGEEIPAKAVISNADPRRTLLKLVDPVNLTPDFVDEAAALPLDGNRGQGQPRSESGCRNSPLWRNRAATALRSPAASTSAPRLTISSARLTNPSTGNFPSIPIWRQ